MAKGWEDKFFSTTGKWWGNREKQVTEDDYERVKTIKRLAGVPPKRILELGSSYGTTALVTAQAGYEVVGVEISDRIDAARDYEAKKYKGYLKLVRADFNHFSDNRRFDVVCYWNGFGIGTDADLQKLLKKMAGEWLSDDGCVLMDLQNPFFWERWAGQKSLGKFIEEIEFDPVKCQFLDTWYPKDKPVAKLTQQMRCFTPADFRLLLENTGLEIKKIEFNDIKEHQYLVKLVKV